MIIKQHQSMKWILWNFQETLELFRASLFVCYWNVTLALSSFSVPYPIKNTVTHIQRLLDFQTHTPVKSGVLVMTTADGN